MAEVDTKAYGLAKTKRSPLFLAKLMSSNGLKRAVDDDVYEHIYIFITTYDVCNNSYEKIKLIVSSWS